IGRAAASTHGLPDEISRRTIERDDVARARLAFARDLLERKDEKVLVDDRGCAVAVLAIVRAEVVRPDELAIVVERREKGAVPGLERHVDARLIERGSARRVAAPLVVVIARRLEGLRPKYLAVLDRDARDVTGAAVFGRARHEDLLPPDHRLRMSVAGKLDPPVVVGLGEGRRDALRIAYARAVRPAEAGPLLGLRHRAHRESQSDEDGHETKCEAC